jgi:hypothetical protein
VSRIAIRRSAIATKSRRAGCRPSRVSQAFHNPATAE